MWQECCIEGARRVDDVWEGMGARLLCLRGIHVVKAWCAVLRRSHPGIQRWGGGEPAAMVHDAA